MSLKLHELLAIGEERLLVYAKLARLLENKGTTSLDELYRATTSLNLPSELFAQLAAELMSAVFHENRTASPPPQESSEA